MTTVPLLTVAERLSWLRSQKGSPTFQLIADATGINVKTVHAHHAGQRATKRGLSEEQLAAYARYYNANALWLARAAGEPFRSSPSGFRRVPVKGILQAGVWTASFDIDEDRYVMVSDRDEWRGMTLYAAEVRGESMNRIYPEGSIVVMRRQIDGPRDLVQGKRYHIERQRKDGTSENTLKTVTIGKNGKVWLVPESTDPEFQTPLEATSTPEFYISFVGRVVQAIIPQ